jgi:integrase
MEDPKRIIEDGYDRIGPQYRPWSDEAMPDDVRGEYLREALSRLSEGADVLELGCGPGVDAAPLAHRRRYTGVDLSSVQLEIARQHVADGTFLHGDFTAMWRATDTLKLTRRLLNAAVDEELILRNPASRVPTPRVELQEPWVLTPEEVEALADQVPERWRAFVLLAAYASLRWSELVALRVDRLDLPRLRIRVEAKLTEYGRLIAGEPKTRQSRRSVAIPEFLALELSEHLRRSPSGTKWARVHSAAGWARTSTSLRSARLAASHRSSWPLRLPLQELEAHRSVPRDRSRRR